MSDQQAPVFSIEKIYTKDISLEIPNAPQIFLERETPEIEVQLRSESSSISEDLYQVLLTVTVTDPILSVACPNVLFPFAREAISDLCNRAGVPPVLLAPVNFDGMYQQRLQAQQQSVPSGEVPIQ